MLQRAGRRSLLVCLQSAMQSTSLGWCALCACLAARRLADFLRWTSVEETSRPIYIRLDGAEYDGALNHSMEKVEQLKNVVRLLDEVVDRVTRMEL